MVLTYSGRSAPSAQLIADCSDDIVTTRSSRGDINWGRSSANTTLNPDISSSTNKRIMRELFAENGVPAPKLYLDIEAIEQAINSGGTLIGRSEYHSKGRGFWVVDSMSRVQIASRGTRKKKPATHFVEVVVAPREYRVHIFRGRSIRISEKQFNENGDKHDYITVRPQHNIGHVRKAAKKAVKAVGLDFGAVDILADDDKCWVLEVNAAPGLGGSMPQVYADAFLNYVRGG